ncbi:protein of unknown function [Burkholderia multivorans]
MEIISNTSRIQRNSVYHHSAFAQQHKHHIFHAAHAPQISIHHPRILLNIKRAAHQPHF